jgi:hypothetical protein
VRWAETGARRGPGERAQAGRGRPQLGHGGWGGKGFLLFIFDFSLFLSFIYFYSNLDIVFESKIQIYFLSLNGCTTTTIQHTIKYLGMLCKNQGPLLGFYFTTLNIYIYTHTHTQNNSPLFRKRK